VTVRPPARIHTCRLTIEDSRGDVDVELDLGRIVHEVPAEVWFEELPDVDVDDGVAYVLTLWIETASRRWPLDDRLIDRQLADTLTENRLDVLIAAAYASDSIENVPR
jgi:hypothetical protein